MSFVLNKKTYVRHIERYRLERIKEVGEEKEILPEDLLAMCIQESFNCSDEATGDGGKAFGAFQIHRGFHKHVTVEEARNFDFSLEWTANRLQAKGYDSKNEWLRRRAISRHNGGNERAYYYGINRIKTSNQLRKYFN